MCPLLECTSSNTDYTFHILLGKCCELLLMSTLLQERSSANVCKDKNSILEIFLVFHVMPADEPASRF